jgi:hypothetical protein
MNFSDSEIYRRFLSLVGADEAGIAHHVCGKNGGEATGRAHSVIPAMRKCSIIFSISSLRLKAVIERYPVALLNNGSISLCFANLIFASSMRPNAPRQTISVRFVELKLR